MEPKQDPSHDQGLPARQVAFHILYEILERKNPMDQVLVRHEGFANLPPQDRALARMIVATTLRHKGQIDACINKALTQKEPLKPRSLQILLYVGITQILFMDVADHAAVDTSVTLAKQENMSRQSGLVNAILRRMTSEGREWIKTLDPVQNNIPLWLLQSWIKDYGLPEAQQIAMASLTEASVDISIKNKDELEYWAGELEAQILPTGSLRRTSGGNITQLSGFEEGSWWVQDAAAALPVLLAGDLTGKTAIDLCAAPGGKTAQLAARGTHVMAVDRSAKRLEKLKENMERLKLQGHVTVTAADGAVWQPPEPVDIVLLDAPCSATGTLRRHPDAMYLKSEQDITRLMDIQKRLLDNAAQMLKPGGMLIYCTCSLQKAESEEQIENFLNTHPDFNRSPITVNEIGGLEQLINDNGEIRSLPYHLAPQGGIDGFFVARLQKG
ncbi:MAG: 16S rRNA (cytosine(967)-C(5))-methyltransferase RsmB [Alphaproteobacteria bacterium]|nr:16S rRNA (cytosine(967)-C(5))-methyltransferase RsmB [Alphaproteobacteria bacterium]